MLNPRQQRFCEEYVIDLNATNAAIRAGYTSDPDSAQVTGSRLLSDIMIQIEVERLKLERSKRTNVTADRVLLEIARLAFNDPRRVFDENGDLLPPKEWPDDVAAAISSIKVTEVRPKKGYEDLPVETTLKEIKFCSKEKGLEMAGRHLAMFTEKLQHSGKDGGPIQVESKPATEYVENLIKRLNATE